MTGERSFLRLRMSAHDAHYGGNLVDGARMLGLFGKVAEVSQNLSAREVEVMRLARDGAGDEAIARALGITVRTVRFTLKTRGGGWGSRQGPKRWSRRLACICWGRDL